MGVERAGWDAAETAARESYGRLVAWLAYRWRDLAAAQDALADALVAALEDWPRHGVPQNPQAWLLTAARRNLLQRARRARVAQSPEVLALLEEEPTVAEAAALPDRRLALLFVCAHPRIPAPMHAPLMLQAVLGLDAKTIAEAFLVSPSAMAQRLVRAKAGIGEAALRFEEPEARELPARLQPVLEGIYGAYAIVSNVAGRDASDPPAMSGLRNEAVYLARLLVQVQPQSAEAHGLLAILLHCEARTVAQFNPQGRFVPLTEQDTRAWDRQLIEDAEAHLRRASQLRSPGRFQLEAAIQSAHCQRAFTGQTPWSSIAHLYAALVAHFPSMGARIGYAVALAESGSPDRGLRALEALDERAVSGYQPYWVARAHLLRKAGDAVRAVAACRRAIGLTADARIRAHLQALAESLSGAQGEP